MKNKASKPNKIKIIMAAIPMLLGAAFLVFSNAPTKVRSVQASGVEHKEVTQRQEIAFATTFVNDPNMETGESVLKHKGINGEKKITFKVTYKDGKETNREIIDETIIKEPVNEVITTGSGLIKEQSTKTDDGQMNLIVILIFTVIASGLVFWTYREIKKR